MADRLDEHLLPAGLAPAVWSIFDATWYLRAHPQAAAAGTTAEELRAHWLDAGQAAGLSPTIFFDETWYRAAYPDVAAAIAAGTWRSGFEHYALAGHADRSPHWLYDDVLYRARNPDITDAGMRTAGCFNAYDHYLRGGCREGRIAHPLFAPSVAKAGFADVLAAMWRGEAERATAPGFDPAWYRAFHPAAEAAIAAGRYLGALHHYLCNETPTRFDPLPDFSESFYLARNPDAAALVQAGVFRNGYAHFLAAGAAQNRAPAPWIDLDAYLAGSSLAREAVEGRTARDSFHHLLTYGRRHGLSASPLRGADGGVRGGLPLAARGRLDFRLDGTPTITALVAMPAERARVLPALEALRAAAPGRVDLVLLDWNGSGVGVQALARGSRLQPMGLEPGSLASAANAALAGAKADLVLMLDGEARPTAAGLQAAIRRMAADASIGALGGPILAEDGAIIAAGMILWADGGRSAYLRGAPAQVSEAGFVRDVDLLGGTLAMLRTSALVGAGGFAEDLSAIDGAADLAIRIWRAGYRVVCDPAVRVLMPGERAARTTGLPVSGSPAFRARHDAYLRGRPVRGTVSEHVARSPRSPVDRVLVLAKSLPGPAEAVAGLVAGGATVTLYPLDGGPADPALLPVGLPDTVEIICGPGAAGLDAFRATRGEAAFTRMIEA